MLSLCGVSDIYYSSNNTSGSTSCIPVEGMVRELLELPSAKPAISVMKVVSATDLIVAGATIVIGCSGKRIDWLQRDGILFLELDSLLRPCGYFAYSSPEAYAQDEEDLRIWKEMSALVEPPGTQPPLCRSNNDTDAVYGVNMEACITHYSDQSNAVNNSKYSDQQQS
ncbi:probable methyltransferase PMT3 [Tanacetum coccineum]